MADGVRSGLPMVRPETASEVEALKARLLVAEQREEAVRMVLRALIASLRPLGFNRKRFLRCVHEEGQDSPSQGPAAIRHTVLHQEARRVLREAR
ncbi:ATP-dependent helicase [Methylorubrum populi]